MHPSLWQRFKSLNWKSPRVILIAAILLFLPFAAELYLKIGIFLGMMISLSALWLIDKMPNWIKRTIKRFALISDFVISAACTAMVGVFFGTGLTLGIAAITATVILSWALPQIAIIQPVAA